MRLPRRPGWEYGTPHSGTPVDHTADEQGRRPQYGHMVTRTTAVLAALAVGTGHFLFQIWLRDLGGSATDAHASATVVAFTLAGFVAAAWLRLPRLRPLLAIVGVVALTGAWGSVADIDAAGAGVSAIAYLAAANALLAVGVVELAGALGIRLQPHAARA
jgi:hypothetical protein